MDTEELLGLPEDQELARLREELDVANRKLAESHRMASLGRLSAGIVHEINTPIGSILSNNEVVARTLVKLREAVQTARTAGEAPNEKTLRMIDSIEQLTGVDQVACERISGIVRSLKTFARVNESDLLKVDINDLFRNGVKLADTVFRRRIVFKTDYGEVPPVECFPGLLGQVLLNLIVNAGQAIDGEGEISVGTRQEGSCVHLWVQDNGSGIPEAIRSKIFAAGFTTKPLGEGTGLGLSISREIIEDTHGGNITFDSEVGHGTTFHVRIPIEQRRRS